MDIAYLSEVRIPDSGHLVIKVLGVEARYHIYHSRLVDNSRRHCVSNALSEVGKAALFAQEPISPRLHMKGAMVNITGDQSMLIPSTLKRRLMIHFMMNFKVQSIVFP